MEKQGVVRWKKRKRAWSQQNRENEVEAVVSGGGDGRGDGTEDARRWSSFNLDVSIT